MSQAERSVGANLFVTRPNAVERAPQREDLLVFSGQFTKSLRRLHAQMGLGRNIIDFDLARPDEDYKYWKEEIVGVPGEEQVDILVSRLRNFDQRAEYLSKPRSGKKQLQLEFLRAKIKAHIAFFERQFDLSEMDPFSYIKETMGIRPQLIPESFLIQSRKRVGQLFTKLDLGEFNKNNINTYRNEKALEDEEEILEWLVLNSQAATDALADFIGIEIDPRISVSVVKEDQYWLNWASGDRENGFELKVNTHPRHRGKWTPGKLQIMPIHEVAGHFAQMTGWLNAIDNDELIEALGLTSTHDPQQFTTEGIAQTLPLYVPAIGELLSDEAWFEFELGGLREMVYNNVHYWANEGPYDESKLVEYIQRFLPAEPEEEIKKEIRERTQDPLLQTYRYAYGIGFYWHRRWADNLTTTAKKRLLRVIYSQPLTPDQEKALVSSFLPQH